MKYLVMAACMGVVMHAAASDVGPSLSDIGVRSSYMACLTAPTDAVPDWYSCSASEYAYQDTRLNRAYKALITKLPKGDRAALGISERRWIDVRDQSCAIDGSDLDGRSLKSNDCVVQLTARRASDLEKGAYGDMPAPFAWRRQIEAFAGSDRKVVAYQVGFLGKGAELGALLILDKATDRSVILAALTGGVLKTIAENDKLVPCATCAGLRGDPLGFARIAAGRFFVTAEGGGANRWSSIYVFAYEPVHSGWYLSEVQRSVSDIDDGRLKVQRLTAKDFGAIRFETFDPAKLPGFNLE